MSMSPRCIDCETLYGRPHEPWCSMVKGEEPKTIDGLSVTEREAEYLMLYHLKQAARLFETTGKNLCERLPADEFSRPAMAAWVENMEALYPED